MSTEKSTSRPVVMSKISGHVYSPDGSRLKGVKVACNGMGTRTLADGFFVLGGLASGTYEVTAGLQGYKSTSKAISIQEGEEITLDFRFSKATGRAKIRGHVYDVESKKPVELGGTVTLILPVANKYKDIDRDGYYEFADLPVGKYKILTSIQGYADNDAILTVDDTEIKTHDFFCKAQKIEEPPWG